MSNFAPVRLTPPINIMRAAPVIRISFWHKYQVSDDDTLQFYIFGRSIQNPEQLAVWGQPVDLAGYFSDYVRYSTIVPLGLLSYYDVDYRDDVRIGFAVTSENSMYQSDGWIDDIRVEGANWGMLGDTGLAEADTADAGTPDA